MKIRLLVLAALLLIPSSLRAADFGLKGVEVSAGIAAPQDFDTGYALGVGLDLGDITRSLTLAASAGYWKASTSDFGVDLDATNLSVGVDVRYYFLEPRRGLYVGGGARINHLSVEAAVPLGGFGTLVVKTTDNKVSPEGVVGWSSSRFYLEGRYNAIDGLNTVIVMAGVRVGR